MKAEFKPNSGVRSRMSVFVVLGFFFVASVGCNAAEAEKQGKAESSPAANEQVMAKVGDVEITREQVEETVAAEIQRLDRERHQVLESGLDALISDTLMEIEAESRGMTPEALFAAEVTSKVAPPSDAAVDVFYEQRKSQIQQPKEQVADRIREYLVQQGTQERMVAFLDELRASREVETFLEPLRISVASEGFPAKGPAQAPVTLVEFSDFECPYCSRVVPTIDQIVETYGDKVRVVFRQFPLNNIHANAQKAAEAALCANDQGKFWELHDLMFQEQQGLGLEQLKEKAGRLGLDTEAFSQCLDSGAHAAAVQADLEAGAEAGVSGTPAMFVNGRFLSGAQPFEEISKIIDDELARAGAAD